MFTDSSRRAVGLVTAGALAFALASAASGSAVAAAVPAATSAAVSAAVPAAVAEGDTVPVGAGSYAATPPASVGQGVQDTLNKKLYIDESLSGEPVPTNAWWTDLLVSTYSGALWADPLVASNSATGTTIQYPTEWNAEGTAMVLNSPLTVGGQVVPASDGTDVVMADFETAIPDGWVATGTAFSTVTEGSAAGQSTVSGYLGDGLLNSFTAAGGDSATGTLTSPGFTVDRTHIAALIGGGNQPGKAEIRLLIDGTAVATATGDTSESLRWITWDVSAYVGQTASIEIIDSVEAGWAHVLVDQIIRTDDVTDLDGRFDTTFAAESADALRWGDWNVSWRMGQAGGEQHIDVTAARGIPYLWFEFDDVTPQITIDATARITDAAGEAVTFPTTTDRFVVTQGGRSFGVHAPADTTFERVGSVLRASEGTDHLVISALPASTTSAEAGAELTTLHRHAFAVPRGTRMTYNYDALAASVIQDWSVETEALEGTNLDTVQGWLPHQWRGTTNNLVLDDDTYETPRGTLKTSVGHGDWTIAYPFEGLTPTAAAPEVLGLEGDYDQATMEAYLADYAAKTEYGADTYWGGKDVLQLAEYMAAAKQIGATDSYTALRASLTAALSDWFSYTEGEKEHFFARYESWGALVGFGESYGSAQFTDNHFHYGYFVLAAALLAGEDPQWAADYGDMATLVAKQYANWDRTDKDFPYLRTFDTWAGHSYAGGFSSPGGNNQESSSEAIQSWAALFLLGSALGDAEMQATGAMGYSTERQAVLEYWLNIHGNPASSVADGDGTFPEAYDHSTTGILFDSGQAYATYFSGDPGWIYGIQWMPTGPWLNYLGWDEDFARSLVQDMFADRPADIGQNGVIGGNRAAIQTFAKEWWGIGSYGDIIIEKNQASAIANLQGAIREAEKNHPGYVTAKVAANPLYNAATDTLYVSVDSDGSVVFPATWWTPETLPASLIQAELTDAMVDLDPRQWTPASAVLPYLSTNYVADEATIAELYGVDVENYESGADTAQAAAVFSQMGDALGNVVLGMVAQYDPELYADVFTVLQEQNDPTVTSTSMAGMVYYTAMSNRGLGVQVRDRHTSSPTSQVYYNDATEQYSYVVYNPSDSQKSYDVYSGSKVIGSIAVPARTQVTHRLDAVLDHIVIGSAEAGALPTTVAPGSTAGFTATGYDQYGATIPVDDIEWAVSGGGTISSSGEFGATTPTESVTITATSGGAGANSGDVVGTYSVRVDNAPAFASIEITPGFEQVVAGASTTFTAVRLDQYGDPFTGAASDSAESDSTASDDTAVQWATTASGTITADGVFTAGDAGAGYVTATVVQGDGEGDGGAAALQTVEGSAVVAVVAEPVDLALGQPIEASSEVGASTAALAVDGDPATRWESAHGTDDETLTVDLGGSYDLSRVDIRWERAAAAEFHVQTSDTAAGPWSTVATVSKTDDRADSVDLRAAATDATGRYLRIQGVSRLTDYGYSIYDLEVFGTRNVAYIEPTVVLVSPRAATVATGRTATFGAFAFDADGNGGAVSAAWSVEGGGSISGAGRFTAPDAPGDSTVTATVSGAEASTPVRIVDFSPVEPTPEPTPTPGPTVAPEPTPTAEPSPEPTPGTATNVAIGKKVQVSSTENSGLAGANAVDGSVGTRWSSEHRDGEWISVDLGEVLPLDSVHLDWEGAFATSLRLQVRDTAFGVWRTVVTDTAGTGGAVDYPIEESARFVRMLGDNRATAYGVSLTEFEVYSTEGSGTPNLALRGPATSSSTEAVFSAANAVDGDSYSRWASAATDTEWLQVDLGAVTAVHSAELDWEGAFGKNYVIQGRVSATGDWVDLATVTNGTGGIDTGGIDTVPIAGDYRYIRMQGIERGTPYGYSLHEFTIK